MPTTSLSLLMSATGQIRAGLIAEWTSLAQYQMKKLRLLVCLQQWCSAIWVFHAASCCGIRSLAVYCGEHDWVADFESGVSGLGLNEHTTSLQSH